MLRFAKLDPTFSSRARPESRLFASRLGHGALAVLASEPPRTGRLSHLRDRSPEHYEAVFRVAVCRIFGLPSSRILSTLRSPTAYASCHLTVQAMRGSLESAGVDMPDDAWATAFADHLARCGGDASVHTAHSWLVTTLRGSWCTRGWRRGFQGTQDVKFNSQRQRRPPRGCGYLALPRHPRLETRS
jgi:hypothetical protein